MRLAAHFLIFELMHIQLRHITIHPALKGVIDKIFVLESGMRLPDPDMKIIVPNGSAKLVIPFRNGLTGKRAGMSRLSRCGQLTFVGVCDLPFTVDAQEDAPSGIIVVEFSPRGAYRFFKLRYSELKNQIFLLKEVLGKTAGEMEETIAKAAHVDQKLNFLQQALVGIHQRHESDPLFDYCVGKIRSSGGRVSIRELEQRTGYSSRWLNMKFSEKLGISPKNFCAITRFQTVFQTVRQDPAALLEKKLFYQLYYDQSHFIREFRRFTGLPPSRFESQASQLSKIFYKN